MKVARYWLEWCFFRHVHWLVTKYLGFRVSSPFAMYCLYRFCRAADMWVNKPWRNEDETQRISL